MPAIERQTRQWPNEEAQIDKQWSTKQYYVKSFS